MSIICAKVNFFRRHFWIPGKFVTGLRKQKLNLIIKIRLKIIYCIWMLKTKFLFFIFCASVTHFWTLSLGSNRFTFGVVLLSRCITSYSLILIAISCIILSIYSNYWFWNWSSLIELCLLQILLHLLSKHRLKTNEYVIFIILF